ncbi:Cd2+/Zn2+-exporting ATPase [Methanomicrobium sp. W14]|uniref:heavy metal translocating P-type ATPase n=1 Tax=Methanomicrobium sp. W14 TaxID=2817839 RepID=UPI001AE2AA8D|nr:cation-translocating P-type ATPase [Methanomicrobium sp. W14]MBP2133831.1 Cd2+/Zn2+-exporting ATPase [Methanomicrobium sp. W14]
MDETGGNKSRHHECHGHECCENEACGCGHSHGKESHNSEYLFLLVAGVALSFAIAGDYFGFLDVAAVSVFALLSTAFTGIPIIYGAVKGLLVGRSNVCELAGLAIAAAVITGEYIVAAEVGFILSIGEIAEDYAYKRSRRDIENLTSNLPKYGYIKRRDKFEEVLVDEINPGDIILVRPGDVVSSDGKVMSGSTSMDESCLTGESVPVDKNEGDIVYSGSINKSGSVQVLVTKKGKDSTYSRIVELVHEAENRRPPSYPFIEKFASLYTPLTLIAVALTWVFTGSLERAITVLIVACPCALLLSTPSAVIAAIGAGAKRGVLFKSGVYLEESGKTDAVLFDKTGTLTTGVMKVSRIVPVDGYSCEEVIKTAVFAEYGMQHPIAKAVVAYAAEKGIDVSEYSRSGRTEGLGVRADSEGESVLAGSRKFFENSGVKISEFVLKKTEEMIRDGMNPVLIGKNSVVTGIIGVEDSVRSESAYVVDILRDMKIADIYVLTGDRNEIAYSVSDKCGIENENVYSEITPKGKKEIVSSLQESGRKVCFVGDGVNDGPAIAQANIGVSMGSRENTVAIETSHAVILKDDLRSLLVMLRLGARALRTIKVNVAFAVLFTLSLVILAFLGIIHPVSGAVGHQVATLGVLANSALLSAGIDKI